MTAVEASEHRFRRIEARLSRIETHEKRLDDDIAETRRLLAKTATKDDVERQTKTLTRHIQDVQMRVLDAVAGLIRAAR